MQPLAHDEPTAVGPYRLLGRLGSGGMGRVYLGRSPGGRTVAVKIVHPHHALDEEFRARFRREVSAARRVGGAWTAPVLDADPGAPVPWVATAYAAGPSLTAAVADAGPLPAHSVRTLTGGLAEALTAVHALGLVHRDVKPSNVLLTLDGPLLIDFGIARATDGTASLTSTGVSVGSPGYMAPEQILGKGVTGAADVFSLGAVLAYAAMGVSPFSGDSSAALLYKVVHEEPELEPLVDGELRELARACLAKDPGDRPGPGEIARRLAPGGAARLVAGGWLPGPLVEQVSRSAVRLLNLETETGAGPPDRASGPVGFSSTALPATGAAGGPAGGPGPGPAAGSGPGTGSAAPVVAGVFGPPPVMPAAPETRPTEPPGGREWAGAPEGPGGPEWPGGSESGGPEWAGGAQWPMGPEWTDGREEAGGPRTSGGAEPHGGPATPGGRATHGGPAVHGGPATHGGAQAARGAESAGGPAAPRGAEAAGGHPAPGRPDPGPPSPSGPGGFSVTVAAGAAPGAGGRGRRMSCSVVLAVAGALAVVTTLGAVLLNQFQGGGQDGAAAGSTPPTDAGTRPSASRAPSPSAPSGAVPEVFLGTWRGPGTVTAAGQDIPGGDYKIVIRRAGPTGVVGSVTQTDALGGTCVDILTLKSASAGELVAVGRGKEGNPSHCVPDDHEVRLRPDGPDALRFTSVDPRAGNPKARVERVA
nr:hypothetical protein StreXyl84_27380 [Streptomyces sp. Xyl84]